MKTYILSLILVLITFSAVNGQSRSATYADIKISLVRGFTLEASGGSSLDLGKIETQPGSQANFIDQQKGLKYLATGYPNRNATISYDNSVILSSRSKNGNNDGSLIFTTSTAQQTGNSPDYNEPTPLVSGSTTALDNDKGTGKLYIWLGGQLDVPADQPHGDYSGTFNISIAY